MSSKWFSERCRKLLTGLFLLLAWPLAGLGADTDWPRQGKLTTPEGDVYYRQAGDGPPLILLHGFTGAGVQWSKYLDELGAHYTIIAPDLPGHGQSENPLDHFSLNASAKMMWSLVDQLGFNGISGIGYSAGGMTLLHMAAMRPERMRSMVMTASAHKTAEVERDLTPFDQLHPGYQSDLLRNHPGGLSQIRRLLDYQSRYAQSNSPLSESTLRQLNVKTLLFSGDRDEVFPVTVVASLFEWLPNASLWIAPGIGHALYWTEWGGQKALEDELPHRAIEFLRPETP